MVPARIRFVTANFSQLQGLRLLPIGFLVLFVGADVHGWLDWLPGRPVERPGDLGNAWVFVAFFLAFAGLLWATDYYNHHYGAVRQFDRRRRNWWIGGAVIAFLAARGLDVALSGPVLVAPVIVLVALLFVVLTDGWVRSHYLIGAAPWLPLSLAPTFDVQAPIITLLHYLLGGLTLIVCGLGDHLVIIRTLRHAATAGPDEQDPLNAQDAAVV